MDYPFKTQERLQAAIKPAYDLRADLFKTQKKLQAAIKPAYDLRADLFKTQERLQAAVKPAYDLRADLIKTQERLQAALQPAYDLRADLQAAIKPAYDLRADLFKTQKKLQAAVKPAYDLRADLIKTQERLQAALQPAYDQWTKEVKQSDFMGEVITEPDYNRAERSLGNKPIGESSSDESQGIKVVEFAQEKNGDSKFERVRGRVVNAAWTLTPSVFFELIKFLLSDGDQQLIYLMEKIKDVSVEEISRVLEEIRKNIDGFLL